MPTENNVLTDPLWALDILRPDWMRLEDYFGLWAIEETRFCRMVDHVDWSKLGAHLALAEPLKIAPQATETQAASEGVESLYQRSGSIAIIPIRGTLMKQQSSMSTATSTTLARRQVRAAAADPEITGILLNIDSPGGTVAGTQALGNDIAAANQQKPVFAFVEDLAASAAYWLAAQAEQIFTIDTGLVGSIGTYLAVEDRSKLAEALKVKVHVIKAGAHKGAGHPGTEITQEQLDQWQADVNAMNEHFLQAVATGRKLPLEKVREIADGRVHLGGQAVQLGLIDGLKSFDDTLQALRERSAKTSFSRSKPKMTTETPAPVAATLAELKAACPNAPADFLMNQLEANATVAAATSAYVLKLQQEIAAKTLEKSHSSGLVGVATPVGNARPAETPLESEHDFCGLVTQAITRGQSRDAAILSVARKYPEAHKAYLIAMNPGQLTERLLREKYE